MDTIMGVIHIIHLALSSNMDQSCEDYVTFKNEIVETALFMVENAVNTIIGKKDFYSCTESALIYLQISLSTMIRESKEGIVTINIQDWYDEYNQYKGLIEADLKPA